MRFYDENSGLRGIMSRIVYQDMENNYWIGFIGDGLSILNSLAFSLYSPGTSTRNRQYYIYSPDKNGLSSWNSFRLLAF